MPRTSTRKLNFTRRTLEALPIPRDEKRTTAFDTQTAGLGFVVFKSGVRSFFHLRRVRGYPHRTTIGRFEDLSIEQARDEASKLNARMAEWKLSGYRGESPFEKRRDGATFGELVEQYIERHVKRHASHPDRAVQELNYAIDKHLASWKNLRLDAISRSDVVKEFEDLGQKHKVAANRLVQLIRRIYNWGSSPDVSLHRGENPARKIKLFHESKRTRFLKPEELPALFSALRNEPNAALRDYVNLALWTGARRGDVLSMRWQNLGLDENRWEIPHPKSREPYIVALTPEAVKILRDRRERANGSEWVFPSKHGVTGHIVDFKRAWKKLLTRAGLADKDLRQHDLRRTLGSYQAAGGTSLGIIGKSLGHTSLAATAIYAQLDLDPVRESVMSATRTMIRASKKKPKLLRAGRS
jgi:integrase